MRLRRRGLVGVGILACIGFMSLGILGGCESTGDGKQAEAPATTTATPAAPAVTDVVGITLSAGASSLVADGASSTTISATLTDSAGKPSADGIVVTFSTDKGRFTTGGAKTATATTAQGTGTVVVPLISEASVTGTANVTASAGGVTRSLQPPITFEDIVGITLTSGAASLTADGISSTTITAALKTTTGVPAPNGIVVTFTTDLGSFTAAGAKSAVATTSGGTGSVVVPFISDSQGGTATIVAKAGGVSQSTTVTLVAPPAGVAIGKVVISVRASPTSILADGVNFSTITALLRTETNNPVVGATVNFSTKCTGTPEAPCGTITASATTNDTGVATGTLISDRKNDEAIVTAAFVDEEARTSVKFTGVTAGMKANPASIRADGVAMSTITATLKDAAGIPIVDEEVTFTTDRGIFSCPADGKVCTLSVDRQQAITATDVDGVAQVVVSSTEGPSGTIRVKGVGASGTITVTFTDRQFSVTCGTPAGLIDPCPSIAVGGVGSTPLTATLLDGLGKAIQGQTIQLSTTLGSLSLITPVTDANGQVQTTLTSGSIVGQAVVTATAVLPSETLQASATVVIVSTTPDSIILKATPSTVSVNGGTSTITAQVRDINMNPVADSLVSFSITTAPGGGEFVSPATAVTDSAGTATTTFTSGSISSRSNGVVLQATIPGPSPVQATTTLTIAGPPATVSVGFAIVDALTNVGGRYLWKWSVIVTDINGNGVPAVGATLGTRPNRFTAFGKTELDPDTGKRETIDPGDTFFSEDRRFFFVNPEDARNDNGLLDAGEDGAVPDCDGNGFMDATEIALQGSACAGSVDVILPGGLPGTRSHKSFPANGRLDPGATADAPKSVTTDTTGSADFDLIYLQSHGCWLEVVVQAESGGVMGSTTTFLAVEEELGCFDSPFSP